MRHKRFFWYWNETNIYIFVNILNFPCDVNNANAAHVFCFRTRVLKDSAVRPSLMGFTQAAKTLAYQKSKRKKEKANVLNLICAYVLLYSCHSPTDTRNLSLTLHLSQTFQSSAHLIYLIFILCCTIPTTFVLHNHTIYYFAKPYTLPVFQKLASWTRAHKSQVVTIYLLKWKSVR